MTTNGSPDLRPLRPQHLDAAWSLTQALAWPHRREDWQMMIEIGQGAVVEAGSKVVGSALWWPCGDAAATLGMIIVDASWRSRGLGRRLMDAALSALAARSVMLNATPVGVPLYRACGFETVGLIHQYQAPVAASVAAESPLPEGIRRIAPREIDCLTSFDSRAFGAPRRALLERLLQSAEFIAMTRDDAFIGYACRRRFGRGMVIGPVAAESEVVAATLVSAWLARTEGFVRTDIPADAGDLAGLLTGAGLARVDEVTTMRRGSWPASRTHRIFGLASQAYG